MPDEEVPLPTSTDVQPQQSDAAAAGTFAFFSLEGTRFDGRGMPADAGREIAAYREAVLQAARRLYKDRHGGDVPSLLDRGFDLRLVRIGGGSARPEMVLARGASVTEEQWAEFVELYELGRDMVTREVHAVTTADEVPSELDTQTRRTLARLGGTLRETERIRLGPPDADRGRAVVTPRTRALLRKSAKQVETPEPRPVFAVGLVTEYNGTTLSFDLKTNDRVITCVLEVFNEQLAAAAREYLALDGVTAPDVRVEGQTLDDEDKIRRIYQVHTLEIVWTVAEKVIVSRLRALVCLGHNWLGPGTEAPTAELAEMLEPLVPDLAALGHPVAIVANADGALVLEWRVGDIEFTAELGADRSLFMCADNVVTDGLASRERPFEVELLRRFLKTGAME